MNTYNLSSNGALAQNSSGGKLLKWKIGNKFIKTSTYDRAQLRPIFLYESYAEVISYRIAKHLGFNAVPYRLCRVIIDDSISTIACECDDFRTDNEQYMSIGRLMRDGKIPTLYYGDLSNYARINHSMQGVTGFAEQLRQIIILDSIILNDDRHYGNFGVIQNNKTGGCRPAPIFDNGNSLFCHKHTEDIEYAPDLISYLRCKPFSIDFDQQLKLVSNIRIDKDKIRKYINNLLREMEVNYELPSDRRYFIRDLLFDRINNL